MRFKTQVKEESIRLSDLKANTEYEIEISAKQTTNGKYTESSNIGFTTLPDPVFGFGMKKSDLFSVKLSWYAPSHRIDYFELTVTEDKTQKQISESKLSSSKTWTLIDNLSSATRYRIDIWTVVQDRHSPKRSKIVHTDLHPPRNINIANITEISAVAQWEPVDADIRTVVILNEPMSKMKKIFSGKNGDDRILLRPLYPGTVYNVDIQHTKNTITSGFGHYLLDSPLAFESESLTLKKAIRQISFEAEIMFNTPVLKIRRIREDTCELLWDDLYDKLDEVYVLKWRQLGATSFDRVNLTDNGYVIRRLVPETDYQVSLQVVNTKNGSLTEENKIEFKTLEKLLPIKNLKIKKIEEYSTIIEWEAQGHAAERFVLEEQGPFSERNSS